jgi:hypothetical protein
MNGGRDFMIKLTLGPDGQYQYTQDGKPLDNIFVNTVKKKHGVWIVETIYTGIIITPQHKAVDLKSPLEEMAKPKRYRTRQ